MLSCLVPVTLSAVLAEPAAAVPVRTAVIEDNDVGSGTHQVSYSGTWFQCGGCNPTTPNRSFRYSHAADATATFVVLGTHVQLYAVRERTGGRMAVSIEGTVSTIIDLYSPVSEVALVYSTPRLPNRSLRVTVTNLGERNPSSAGTVVGLDRMEVFTDAEPEPVLPLGALIEDENVGTNLGQVAYSGEWVVCGGCNPPTPSNSFRYARTAGATATFRFSGVRLDVFGVRQASGGRFQVSVDGSPPVVVDLYAATTQLGVVYRAEQLASGSHVVTVTVLGQRSAAARDVAVAIDRAQAYLPVPSQQVLTGTIEDTSVGTQVGQVLYTGDWVQCGGCQPATANNSFRYSRKANSTATIRFSGDQIALYAVREASGGLMSVSVDGSPPVVVDLYAATSQITNVFQSPVLAQGEHHAVLTNLGQRNPASRDTVTLFDRADIFANSAVVRPPAGFRSGLPWLSGVNGDPRVDPQSVDAFCDRRTRPCDISLVYVGRESWNSVTRPGWLFDAFRDWPGRLALNVPPYPERIGASLQTCAAGAYDGYWRGFGQMLNDYGRQNSIVQLAWEANGNWFEWSATDPAAYVNCWRRVADAINSTANPDPVLTWTINAHYSQNPPSHNPLDIYPGDAWVDAIGIDAYDLWPPSPTRAQFNQQANTMGGISWLYNFARARGKLFAVGEWGVVSGAGANGGGDNPNYVDFMYEWFVAHQDFLLFESYFNNCDPGNVGSNLFRPLGGGTSCLFQNPSAANRYEGLW